MESVWVVGSDDQSHSLREKAVLRILLSCLFGNVSEHFEQGESVCPVLLYGAPAGELEMKR